MLGYYKRHVLRLATLLQKLRATPTDLDLLEDLQREIITGQSGVGKEVVAREIHRLDKLRAGESFIAVNCGGIPASLLEAELFGDERGAFTGALRLKRGLLEQAAGGTLFSG